MSASTPAIDELRPVRGPSAFSGTLRRGFELLWLMSTTEFRVRYANAFFSYAWTIVRPLIFFGVIFLILRQVIKFGSNIENYGLILILNIVMFQYFQETTSRGVRAVSAREGLIRKMQFPRIVIPLSVSLSALFSLLLNFVAVIPIFLVSGLEPRLSWLLLVPLLAGLVLLTTAVAMILSVLFVRFQDVGEIWSLTARMLFYASPILFVIEIVPEGILRDIISANPLSLFFEQARVWVIDPGAPSAVEASGWLPGLAIPLAISVATCIFAVWLFAREAPRVAEAV